MDTTSRRTLIACAFVAAGCLLATVAQTEGEQAPDGATLYKERTCFTCHGADAKSPILPDYPKLAGQNEPYLLQQMKDIKSGARANSNTPAMRGVMHLVDDSDMAALAQYISGLAP